MRHGVQPYTRLVIPSVSYSKIFTVAYMVSANIMTYM